MAVGFQMTGDCRMDPGLYPEYDSNHPSVNTIDYQQYPFTRLETQNVAQHTWTSWKRCWNYWNESPGTTPGRGPNKLGSSGFWIKSGPRWMSDPGVQRSKRIQLAQEHGTQTVIYDLIHDINQNGDFMNYYPLALPPGRIVARSYSDVTSDHHSVLIHHLSQENTDLPSGYTSYERLGYTDATFYTRGVAVTPGTSASGSAVWGSWTYIGTSTIHAAMIRAQMRSNGDTSSANNAITFQIGIGDANSVGVVWSTMKWSNTGNGFGSIDLNWHGVDIPAHTNFYIRQKSFGSVDAYRCDFHYGIEVIG